jgi:hypothetical protein
MLIETKCSPKNQKYTIFHELNKFNILIFHTNPWSDKLTIIIPDWPYKKPFVQNIGFITEIIDNLLIKCVIMKMPGILKFILFSAIIYQILSFKPIKKLILGFVVTAAAAYVRRLLKVD